MSSDRTRMWWLFRELYAFTMPKGDSFIRNRIFLALGCLIVARVSAALIPQFYGRVIDAVNTQPGFTMGILIALVGGYMLVRFGEQAFEELKEFLFARVIQRAVRGAAIAAFRHVHQLSLKFHLDRQTGGLGRSIDRGAKAVQQLLGTGTFEVIPLFIEVIVVSLLLWALYGWEYAVIVFVIVSLYSYFTIRTTEWRMAYRKRLNEADEAAATKTVDSLLNFETVKYFNAEDGEARRYDASLREYEDAAVLTRTSLSVVNIGQGLLISSGMALLMILAGRDIQAGDLTVGDFVAINTYLLQLYAPLNFLGWIYREIRQSILDLENMLGLLDEHSDIQDREGAPSLQMKSGEIAFKDVHFSYNERPILRGVSFTVPAGRKVAIVGPSGSGKTTLSRLLFRFYDPQAGGIYFDGQNIAKVRQDSVRAAIGVVPQDTVMFNASIGYNIGYGKEGATEAEIKHAAKMAAIDGFIENLDKGYDTLVGERGLKLSGGEKQRVAIARAILKAPTIYLFDEATSALDSQTEKDIQEALNMVSSGQTTLVIAHRLSTVVDADEILVLAEGKIVERGTHQQLLAADNIYASMWNRQSKGFDDNAARITEAGVESA